MLKNNALITTPEFWEDTRISALPIVQRFILIGLASMVEDRPLIAITTKEAVRQLNFPSGYPPFRLLGELEDLATKGLIHITIDRESVEIDLASLRGLFGKPTTVDSAPFQRQVSLVGNVSALNMVVKKETTDPYRLNVEQVQVEESDVGLLARLVRQNRLQLVLRELPPANGAAPTEPQAIKVVKSQQAYDPWATENDNSPPMENCTLDEEQLAEYMTHVKSSKTLIAAPD